MKYSSFTTREKISIPTESGQMILNKLKWGERILLLYDNAVDVSSVFSSFINNGLANGDLCLYAFESNSNKLFFERKDPNLRIIPLDMKKQKSSLEKFYERLIKMYIYVKAGKCNGLRILTDFGNASLTDHILNCERELFRKSKESSRLVSKTWSKLSFKHYKTVLEENFPIITLTAYNISSADNEKLKSLIELHERIIISTQNHFTALLPNFPNKQEIVIESPVDAISEEAVEEFVKNNLETMILSILCQQAMSGYDIIKTISKRYNVFLNQATVYSTLYSLEKVGILQRVNLVDNKTKVFSLSDEGKNIAKNKLRDFTNMLEHTFSFLKVNNRF